MKLFEIAFWISFSVVAYTYFGYPALLALLVRPKSHPSFRTVQSRVSVSVVIAAHNEAKTISSRVSGMIRQMSEAETAGEVIVVSDGSTDETAKCVRELGGPVRLIELPTNQGKASALNVGCSASQSEILVFADARQTWESGALRQLIKPFCDPSIGAVSGDLVLEDQPGVAAGIGLYWRYEKWIRRTESRLDSCVGVTGAISAVRRALYSPIPPGTLLDDLYWPLRVVMQGYRVIHSGKARAFDRLPDTPAGEFRRKVRTLAGNFQLLARLPGALFPWRNRLLWQFYSHKLLRLIVPWALLAMLVSTTQLDGAMYQSLFVAQLTAYSIALLGLVRAVAVRSRLASALASFLVLNAAAWLAFWVWTTGGSQRAWRKTAYASGPATAQ
jgi:cellulose synthase/poly-beta-1,6-N-acetylglucosamine synthase-like glycosyltransferase